MEIRTTYIGTLDGVNGMWCGFKPEGAKITEERIVLYAADGCVLVNIKTGEKENSVWIKSEEQKKDWVEVEYKEDAE